MRFLTIIFSAIITILAAIGGTKLGFDNNYRNVFKNSNDSFKKLEQFYDAFSLDENDFLVLIKSENRLGSADLRRIREIDSDLRIQDNILSVSSIFDARQGSDFKKYTAPLFPDNEGEDKDFSEALEQARNHPLLKNILLSEDGTTTLLLATSEKTSSQSLKEEESYRAIQKVVRKYTEDSKLTALVGGMPALHIEVLESSKRDQLRFTILGGLLGAIISGLLLRSFRPFLVVMLPPLIGTFWVVGFLGLFNENFNVINTIIPILVLIVGYTDSLHLMFSIIQKLEGGFEVNKATSAALREIGPACILTSITTAVAFGSLILTQSDIIKGFGVACAVGVLLNLISVLTLVPLLANFLLKEKSSWENVPQWEPQGNGHPGLVRRITAYLNSMVLAQPKKVSLIAIGLTVVFSYASTFLEPDSRYRENLPTNSEAFRLLEISDEKFGGSMPIRVLVEWDPKSDITKREQRNFIEKVSKLLSSIGHTGKAFSVIDIEDLGGKRVSNQMLERFINEEKGLAVVSAYMKDLPTAKQIVIFDDLKAEFLKLNKEYPLFTASLTGLQVVTSEQSYQMIGDLARSLGFAAIVIFLAMTVALRSLVLGVISVIPNIFPIAASATVLLFAGYPLQYATVIVFTVSLGIAVDDTIHYLLRYKKEIKKGGNMDEVITRTSGIVGFVIITTTVILVSGMASILLSSVPSLRLFGATACVSLLLALVGDIIFLPAMLRSYGKASK